MKLIQNQTSLKKIPLIIILVCSSLCLIANDTITCKNDINLSLSNIKFEDDSF